MKTVFTLCLLMAAGCGGYTGLDGNWTAEDGSRMTVCGNAGTAQLWEWNEDFGQRLPVQYEALPFLVPGWEVWQIEYRCEKRFRPVGSVTCVGQRAWDVCRVGSNTLHCGVRVWQRED
jgi:hypothetical protein